MILLSHPIGNANVRAVLQALQEAGLLAKYVTALGWSQNARWLQLLPTSVRGKFMRRAYSLPNEQFQSSPCREIVRLLASSVPAGNLLTAHETGWASIDAVWQEADRKAARYLRRNARRARISAVYAYED